MSLNTNYIFICKKNSIQIIKTNVVIKLNNVCLHLVSKLTQIEKLILYYCKQ